MNRGISGSVIYNQLNSVKGQITAYEVALSEIRERADSASAAYQILSQSKQQLEQEHDRLLNTKYIKH